MKLQRAEMKTIRIPLREPFHISKYTFEYCVGHIIQLTSEDGTVGYGESVQLETPWYSAETLKTSSIILRELMLPTILSGEADTASGLLRELDYIQGNQQSLSAIDTALLDIDAKKAGLPLWKFIGGVNDRVSVGASIGLLPEQALLGKIEEYLSNGFRRIKVKIMPGNDIRVVEAIRNRLPGIDLTVDANAAYTIQDKDIFLALDTFGLSMIEQPFGNGDLIEHAELQQLIKTPLCLDESVHDMRQIQAAVALDACRIINLKPPRVGGPSSVLEMLRFLKECRVGAWIGGMLETGVGRMLNLTCATLDGVCYPSDLRPPSDYLFEDITDAPFTMRDGYMHLPQTPGLGVQPNPDKLERYTTDTFVLGGGKYL